MPQPHAAGHTAIQLAQLARMAELGLELIESAARLAKRDMAEPPPDPEPVAAEDAVTEHLYYPCPTDFPRPQPRNPIAVFDQLCRNVRACIKLATQITTRQSTYARPTADPRRPILRRALRPFIHTVPDEPPFPPGPSLQEIDNAVDQELQADPDRLTPLTELLTLICEDLGLNPEIIHLPTSQTPAPLPEPPGPD